MAGATTIVAIAAPALLALASCGGSSPTGLPGADADRGRAAIERYGCGACHQIGGIDTANGTVGPSLKDFRSNRYIAGDLPNTPENVSRWIQDPQRYRPGTIMPDLGVPKAEADDIVAYLEGQ